jgi:hypothetical protein
MLGERREHGPGALVAGEVQSVYRELDRPVNGEAPAPLAEGVTPPPLELSRAEIAGYRAGRMTGAAFQALSETFQPQVAAQLALDLTKTVLTSPSGARILEE